MDSEQRDRGVAGRVSLAALSAAVALCVAACATGTRCPSADLGGWAVDDAYGIQHDCTEESERFVLRVITGRRPDGRVAGWTELAVLRVPLRRGESTMFGFECGSQPGKHGDAIAVVRYHRDGSFDVIRAWIIDAENRKFVSVPPATVVCEPLEEEAQNAFRTVFVN